MSKNLESRFFNWLSERFEAGAAVLYTCCCISMALSYIARERSIRATKKAPTVAQYYQRLIEFYDPPYVLEAAKRLDRLIQLGVSPEHAFRMITSD